MLTSALIFALTYMVIGLGGVPRLRLDRPAGALLGAVAMVALGVIGFDQAVAAIDLDTILFLLGMMIVLAYLELSGFYQFTRIGFPSRDQRYDVHLARLQRRAAHRGQAPAVRAEGSHEELGARVGVERDRPALHRLRIALKQYRDAQSLSRDFLPRRQRIDLAPLRRATAALGELQDFERARALLTSFVREDARLAETVTAAVLQLESLHRKNAPEALRLARRALRKSARKS